MRGLVKFKQGNRIMIRYVQRMLRHRKVNSATRRLVADRSGSAVVEFAFVALPTIALIVGTAQTAFVFFANQALQTVTTDVTRQLMTGNMQGANATTAYFMNKLCSSAQMPTYISCSSGSLYFQVAPFPTGTGISGTPPAAPAAPSTDPITHVVTYPASSFTPVTGNSIIIVRVYYDMPVIPGLVGGNMGNGTSGTRLLTATSVVQAEPF